MFPPPAGTHQPPFVDSMNVSGHLIDKPTWADFASLESQLQEGALLPFALERLGDRDASLEVSVVGDSFAIVGAEDSGERGTFAFSYLDPSRTSRMVLASGHEFPEYCTTSDVRIVIAVARTYFRTGELDRSVAWHVSRRGIGGRLESIPSSEILPARDNAVAFMDVIARS